LLSPPPPKNFSYDATATAALELPINADGAAFKNRLTGAFAAVLWAKTRTDLSEQAQTTWIISDKTRRFLSAKNPQKSVPVNIQAFEWDFSRTKKSAKLPNTQITLKASPSFFFF
jgi:hypothetical protein